MSTRMVPPPSITVPVDPPPHKQAHNQAHNQPHNQADSQTSALSIRRARAFGTREAQSDVAALARTCDGLTAHKRALATLLLVCRERKSSLDPCSAAEYSARLRIYQAAYERACDREGTDW